MYLDGPEDIHILDTNSTTITKPHGDRNYVFNISDGNIFEALTCRATCHPNCTYTWTKQGIPVKTSGATLDLGVAHKETAGMYICTAFGPNIHQTNLFLTVHVICK